jgi:hypothetical protein
MQLKRQGFHIVLCEHAAHTTELDVNLFLSSGNACIFDKLISEHCITSVYGL